MPAKDYHLVVGCFGTVYIARKKKTKDNVMSSDRIEVDVNHFYQLVHQFAEATIKKGFSELEVKNKDGSVYLSIRLPNPKVDKRNAEYRQKASEALEQTKSIPRISELENIEKIEELAGYILKLTN